MGCDIHPHVEVLVAGRWEHYSNPPILRWYQLFEKICGVRGDVANAIAPPRDLPTDLNIVTQICWAEDDGHSATWLTKQELVNLINWADKECNGMFQHHQFGYLCGNNFDSKVDGIDNVRFICWFDN